jgi:hypothetical protein
MRQKYKQSLIDDSKTTYKVPLDPWNEILESDFETETVAKSSFLDKKNMINKLFEE